MGTSNWMRKKDPQLSHFPRSQNVCKFIFKLSISICSLWIWKMVQKRRREKRHRPLAMEKKNLQSENFLALIAIFFCVCWHYVILNDNFSYPCLNTPFKHSRHFSHNHTHAHTFQFILSFCLLSSDSIFLGILANGSIWRRMCGCAYGWDEEQ